MISFSIIIPTSNRPSLLKLCLSELYKAVTYIGSHKVEIIVTDDSSDERSKDLLKTHFPQVRFMNGPRKGPAANRNNGAKSASGQWLLFLDDDIIPDVNLISDYINAISLDIEIAAFEGAIFPDDWKLLEKDMAECPINTYGGCFWSANVCIKKELFFKIGGFNEQYTIAAQEDQDIFAKIKVHTPVPFLKNAFVIHPVRIASLKKKIQLAPSSIINWLIFQQKTKSLASCFEIGYKSQISALVDNVKKMKPKSSIYNMYIIFIFPFVVLRSKIN